MCEPEGTSPVGEAPEVLVIVLSQYSLPCVGEIYNQAERSAVPDLITIQLDDVGDRLKAKEKYQRIDVRTWNFGRASAELHHVLEAGSKDYTASVDARAFKGRSYAKALTYTFFYSAALFCIGHAALVCWLLQRVPDLKGQAFVVLAPILCYSSGAYLLFQTASRRYTLKYAAIVSVCIEILSVSYAQFLSDRGTGYRLSGMILVLAGACWAPVLALISAFSDRLRYHGFRLLDRLGVKDTRLHPLSMVIWEPYRPGDWQMMLIFIPLFLFAMLLITMTMRP